MSNRTHRLLLQLCLLLNIVLTGCAPSFAQPQQLQLPEGNQVPPKVGVRVIEIIPAGPAEGAGVQVMDLLSKYGKFTIVDHSTYYKAREFYLRNPNVKVKLEFWRGRSPFTIEAFPGTIGMDTNEYNVVAYQLDSAMMHVDALQQISEFARPVEFKAQFENGGIPEALNKAREIIDRAEADGTLTPMQILVGRIRLILDDAPEDELHKLNALLAEFIRSQPPEYIGYLGDILREKQHYRAGKALLQAYLATDPDDISVRLNLGQANLALGLWAEAEACADYVLADADSLSDHGLFVAYQQKAYGALSRSDYEASIAFAEKAFAIEPGGIEMSIIQLSAALTGNMEKFNEASKRYKETLPKNYETFQLQIASVEALALAVSGNDALAREVIARPTQKDRIEGRLKHYWRGYPHGNKVVENWMRLAKK